MFTINSVVWTVEFVQPDSILLYDRTGHHTVATTDPYLHKVYLSIALSGDFLRRVLTHELGHCVMVSYGTLDYVNHMTKPEHRVEMEEYICNFLADYSPEVTAIVEHILQGR